ncbi:MAG: hypothetical protein H6729_02360 [Deltaproteobacteria bacterium]|nr:hypothetical protein [Deltaproteobacteria bacterium]
MNVTDVLDPNNWPGSESLQIHRSDLPQFLAFNTVDGAGYSTGGDMWHKDQTFVGADKPDIQVYFNSNFYGPALYVGRWNGTAFINVADGGTARDLRGRAGEFYVGSELLGVDPASDDDRPGHYSFLLSDYLLRGHNPSLDTFFELQIPLRLLGIAPAQLDRGTIGLFVANGDGSAVDSIPDDPATRSTPGVSLANSPLEWNSSVDDDAYSVPFAWIGTPR